MTNTLIMSRLRARSAGAIRSGGTGGGGLPYLVSSDYATITDGMNAAVAAGKRLYIVPGTYTGALTLIEGADLFGDGAAVCWLKGKITSAPHVTLTDLKVGDEVAGTYGGFGNANTHSMACTRVTFTGGSVAGNSYGHTICYLGRDFYNCTFVDCIIEGDPTNTDRNGLGVTNYGQASARVHDVLFDGCTFRYQGRMAAEILSRSDGTHTYNYPVQAFDFLGCTFTDVGSIAISLGFHTLHAESPPDGLGGAGWGNDGYSRIEDCHFTDPGMISAGVCVELAPAVHMSIKRNHMVVTSRAAYCSNFFSITNGGSTYSYADTHNGVSTEIDCQNVYDSNIFDASLSTTCGLTLRNSGWTFSNNTVTKQKDMIIDNARGAVVTGGSITTVGADGSTPGTVRSNLLIQCANGVTISGVTLTDNYNPNVRLMNDTRTATNPALNVAFSGNTYSSGGGHYDISSDADSAFTASDTTNVRRQ
jgi:hypothetical protein